MRLQASGECQGFASVFRGRVVELEPAPQPPDSVSTIG